MPRSQSLGMEDRVDQTSRSISRIDCFHANSPGRGWAITCVCDSRRSVRLEELEDDFPLVREIVVDGADGDACLRRRSWRWLFPRSRVAQNTRPLLRSASHGSDDFAPAVEGAEVGFRELARSMFRVFVGVCDGNLQLSTSPLLTSGWPREVNLTPRSRRRSMHYSRDKLM